MAKIGPFSPGGGYGTEDTGIEKGQGMPAPLSACLSAAGGCVLSHITLGLSHTIWETSPTSGPIYRLSKFTFSQTYQYQFFPAHFLLYSE
jgi:hypothetical protein